ncbi:aldehyde dehydrogenase family protein [Pseudohaliea sp.]|uniref:aldehyde dehydrogenase family protein n=1 Tax=Pseudohaliea sp. TaxID=2740289 RepID=UPI0032ED17C1
MTGYTMLINGEAVAGDESFDVLNPSTDKVLATCPSGSQEDLENAVAAAKGALPDWSALPIEERSACLLRMADRLEENLAALAALLSAEQGKPVEGYAGLGANFEVGGCLAWIRYTAGLTLPVEVVQDNEQARIEVHRKPVGVVGSITPWNYPLLITCWHIVPALLAGCSVVVKPSEYTPLTVLKAMHLVADLFPPGVLNVIAGPGAVGAAMAAHGGINKIVFTGSTATGKRIMEAAAGNIKRLTLELGGNDAAIVLPDVDVEEVAGKIFATSMINNGQTCAALKRLYVHDDIYDELCEALARLAASVTTGPANEAPDFGPLQNRQQFNKVCALADAAAREGAVFLSGGRPLDMPGYFFPVTIVRDIQDSSELVTTEQFGPILPVMRFTDIDDVIRRSNALELGLGGSVWSADTVRATELASRLECGTAWVNDHAAIQPDAPFGGAKESGLGVEFGVHGLLEYTQIQTVQICKC